MLSETEAISERFLTTCDKCNSEYPALDTDCLKKNLQLARACVELGNSLVLEEGPRTTMREKQAADLSSKINDLMEPNI